MAWYWIAALVLSGIGIGLLLAYLVFMHTFTDGFRNFGP